MNKLQLLLDHLNLSEDQVEVNPDILPYYDIAKSKEMSIHVIDDEGIYALVNPSLHEMITLREKGKIKKLGITLSGLLHALRYESEYEAIVYQIDDKKYCCTI